MEADTWEPRDKLPPNAKFRVAAAPFILASHHTTSFQYTLTAL